MPDTPAKELVTEGPLQNVSLAYRNKNYIGDRVFPILDGVDPKVKIYKILKGSWFRNDAAIRGEGGRAPRSGMRWSPTSIAPAEYSFASEVTDEMRKVSTSKNAPPLQPDQNAIEFCSDKIDLSKEVRIAAAIKAATWADGNATGEDAEGLWAPAGSTNTFLADITTGRKAIQSTTGYTPNKLIIDFATYEALKLCDQILDKIKYTQRGVLTLELLAAICDLEQVLIGEAIVNTAKETKAGTEFTASYVWEVTAGKGMGFLFYSPPSLGLKVATAGLQARTAYANGQSRQTLTWREPAEHQDVYEVDEETDIVVVGTDLGYKWKDTFLT